MVTADSDEGDILVASEFSPAQLNEPGTIHAVTFGIDEACVSCRAQGCADCAGEGHVVAERTVRFRLPTGIEFGKKIRLAGKGTLRVDGGRGDLYIELVPLSTQPPSPFVREMFPARTGRKITPKMMAAWNIEMTPVLFPDERVDYIVRTIGISPPHDHCIITPIRVWIAKTSSSGPAFHLARTDIVDATPLQKHRVLLHMTDGTGHNIPLLHNDDRPDVLRLLRQPPPDHFVPYAADVVTAPSYEFDASKVPEPGDRVPPDCVWSRIPYPGPLRKGARSWFAAVRASSIDPVARPLNQLVAILGNPNAQSEHPDGTFTLQWQEFHPAKGNSYHLVMSFDRYGVCESLDHRWSD